MTWETFEAALAFTHRVEGLARQATGYNLLLLSGGECTEHPRIVEIIDRVIREGFQPVLVTNGMWLNDPALAPEILSRKLLVQITNDSRFYPKASPRVNRPNVVYVDSLTAYIRQGRGEKFDFSRTSLPARKYPGSFNLRSFVHAFRDIRLALVQHRQRALTSLSGGHCTPTISYNGEFIVGESRFCASAGTVHSTPEEITANILNMGACNRCGLESNLDARQKAAIGVP